MLCDMKSNQLGRHIVTKHAMTTAEYKKRFPFAKVAQLSKKQLEKMISTKSLKTSKNKTSLQERKLRQQESLDLGYSVLKCGICGYESILSLISHITRKHKLLMIDYRKNFPESKVQQASPHQLKRSSEVMKEKLKDELELKKFLEWRSYPSEIKHWTKKGFSEEEAKEKIREFQIFQNKKSNTPEIRKKFSEIYSGENNPMSLVSIANRFNISLDEASQLTPAFGRKKEKHPMWGKKHTQASLEKIASAHHLSNPSWRSKPEMELESWLITEFKDKFICNVKISRWNVDFLFKDKNIIVELFGDFWHMNPSKYGPEDINKVLKKSAEYIWQHDLRKVEYLKSSGYNVLVVWENEWKRQSQTVKERIKDAYNRTP